MLAPLPAPHREALVKALTKAHTILDGAKGEITLRAHRPGDMGWVTSANAALYAQEYGWDISYEALVARITADFIENFAPRREYCWIAEMDGERVGSAFVVKKTDAIAKLRLLIVDPKARGIGLGKRLVDECLRFAKEAGYTSMTLWTQANLLAARGIYARAGFTMTAAEPNRAFGVDLVSETWERAL